MLIFAASAYADCTPGTNWTVGWTDNYGQTTYTLEAPCKVYIGIPFNITATVTDNTYPNSWVAFNWAVKDNGDIIAGGTGFNWLSTVNGIWQQIIERTYSGTPIDHTIEFKFTDLGAGAGAHYWSNRLIGNISVDPYPIPQNNPPVADAGPDIMLSSKDQAVTVINGYASDADALTYRWLEGETELQPYQPVDSSGDAPLMLGSLPPLSIGTHTFILEVSDGKDTGIDEVRVSVENSAPTVAASGSGTFQMWTDISLNGSVSDYDGDVLEYTWLEGSTVLASGAVNAIYGGSPVSLPVYTITGGLPLGVHTLTLNVTDGIHSVSDTININVIDTIAPTLAPVADENILWPPNHEMVDVKITANAVDNSKGAVSLTVMVNCNELPEVDINDNIIPDYSIVIIDQQNGIIYLQLRAARAGNRNGRIYTVTITATDESGNSSSADVQIKVPHDMGKK